MKRNFYKGEGSWGVPTMGNDDDKPWTLSSDSFWQFNLVQVDGSAISVKNVRFGSEEEPYDPSGGADLTQRDPAAMNIHEFSSMKLLQSLGAGHEALVSYCNCKVTMKMW